ncbi:hypothetical protein F5Y06DRAFT_258285 [Hypoxylon sp. FL0890]|nr:hypothetical protein F5Y06DRAFT_258285 [Hypoxylon sp. FL0890]
MPSVIPTVLVFGSHPGAVGRKQISRIREHARVYQEKYVTPETLAELMYHDMYRSVLPRTLWIMDHCITQPQFREISNQIVEYVRTWRYGRKEDIKVGLQRSSEIAVRNFRLGNLMATYYTKAVFLKNVAASDSWFVPDPEHNSLQLESDPDSLGSQASVACRKVGNGWFGWIGDIVDNEGEMGFTTFVVETMIRLHNMSIPEP